MSGQRQWQKQYGGEVGREDSDLLPRDTSTPFDPLWTPEQVARRLNVSPDWEFNFGVGIGPTAATDHWIIKCIIGRRFQWGKKR